MSAGPSRRWRQLGPQHRSVAISLVSLGNIFYEQTRFNEAIALYARAVEINRAVLGANNVSYAVSLNNLAHTHAGAYAVAEPLHREALAIREAATGKDSLPVASSLHNLADVGELGRFENAAQLYARALDIRIRRLGETDASVADTQQQFARSYRMQRLYASAEPLLLAALRTKEKLLDPDHPEVADARMNLATLYREWGRLDDSLQLGRPATANLERHLSRNLARSVSSGWAAEVRRWSGHFIEHIELLYEMRALDPVERFDKSFRMLQLSRKADAATQLSRLNMQFAASGDALSVRIRTLKDLAIEATETDLQLVSELQKPTGKRDTAAEEALRQRLATTTAEIERHEQNLRQQFPEFESLSNPPPLTLAEVRKLLRPKETLVAYLSSGDDLFAWLINAQDAQFVRVDVTSETVSGRRPKCAVGP